MTRENLVRILAIVLTLCLALPAFSANLQAAAPAPVTGQTATLLPDGTVLLAGGQDSNGNPRAALAIRDAQGAERPIGATLQFARTGHTATVLPDGSVLVLGGIGSDGLVVAQAEIFDPQTQSVQPLTMPSPTARVFHSATLLTDGRVLIAGGVSDQGAPLKSIELWDPRQNGSIEAADSLGSALRHHAATLLADGRVLLAGGIDGQGNASATAEIFDPQSRTVSQAATAPPQSAAGAGITEAAATSPEDSAVDVPVTALISVRFSRPVQMAGISERTVELKGPAGIVDAKITGAENGMLAFIVPRRPLAPGTVFSVTISGVLDTANANVAFAKFTFATAADLSQADLWTPNADWRTHNGPSPWQSMAPLQAPPGVTALAGQVLKLDGTPLPHVTLQIGTQQTFTDGTGRFLLTGLTAGRQPMLILGDSASNPVRKYGVFEVRVEIQPQVTNVLNYTIWMTPLDTAHTVKIPSPTTAETVVTSPLLPGLELHLPANTVITDRNGKPVTEISITPIPLDRPPFPLPTVPVPIYFTIQPGSAYIKVNSTTGPKGARLFYPNALNYPPGTPYQFWNYDADNKGWYIYGNGRVSQNRAQIIPDPGVEVYEFTGAMVANPGNAPPSGPNPGNDSKDGEPVDLATGLFVYNKTDLALPDLIPLSLTRTYRQNDPISRSFGIGTSDPYDMFMIGDNNTFPEGYTYQDLILADGGRIHFQRISPCTGTNGYCDFTNAVYEHTSTGTDFYGAIIKVQSCTPNGFWTLTKKDGTVYCFPDSDASNNPRSAAPTSMRDRFGNTLAFTRDVNHNLTQITSPNGRWIQFTYDASNRITQAKDNIGRTVIYTYDAGGRLTQVTDANSGVWNYTYDAFNQMTSIRDPRGILYLTNQYDQSGKVIQQTQADNTNFIFSYTADPTTGAITQTDVTGPRGFVKRTAYNAAGYKVSEIFALGRPEQQTVTYNRDPNTSLLNSVTDPLGRQTSYTHDALGNVTSITRLAGTPNAVTTSLTYEPLFNQVASITDALNHTTVFSYDAGGNLTSITDPLGHQTTVALNSQGRPVSATDAAGNTAQFTYDGTDLVGITDPLGNTSTRFVDSVGRVAAMTDALGRVTRYTYNPLNQILQITDPLQAVTSFTYDLNGNLLSVQDARQGLSTFTYNNRDLVATRTDPLQRQESYAYDLAGNLVSATDRKGQVTTFQYDALNRPTFAGFGTQVIGGNTTYASTISYQYDSGSRLTQAADSVGGTITRAYDNLDRLTSESTPQGSVSYTLDAAGRRTGMTVLGQAAVSYSYDNANRLVQISQGSASVSLSYDNANRRTSLTLPNGVSMVYTYDNNSRVTGTTYNFGATRLGDLSYAYDALGQVVQKGGSLARTGLPQPVVSAAYDAANELTGWNGIPVSYDSNGNMLSDGTNTFAWDARNHLSALNGSNPQYDAFGRRIRNLSGTSFLYDGANAVQELAGATVTANLLTGAVDEVFSRSDSTGSFGFLTDMLGSTIALADGSGNLATSYTYDPFGVTALAGLSSASAFQYTGRENEGNGLYYYRARYYNPALGRFVSEDPIGFNGGAANLYAYVGDNPINFTDPSGKNPIAIIVTVAGGIAGGISGGIEGYRCGDTGWKLAGDIGRGVAGGAAGAFVDLVVTTFTDSPFLGGAAGSFVNDGIQNLLGGHVDPASVPGDMLMGGITGKLGDAVAEVLMPVRGGQNFNPLTSPRTWGPRAQQEYVGDAFGAGADIGGAMGKKCECH